MRITLRQGIQKALSSLAIVAIVGFPLIGLLGIISSRKNEILMPLVSFRSGYFAGAIETLISGQINLEPATIIVSFIATIAGIMIMLAGLAVVVVLAGIVGENRLVKLAIRGIEIGGGIVAGAIAQNDGEIFGVKGIASHITLIVLSAALTITLVLLGSLVARGALAGDEKHLVLRQIAVFLGAIGGTSFHNANLTDANFSHATFKSADLRRANTTRTLWRQARHLELARLGDTILIDPDMRDLLVTGDGYQKSYIDANLQGANLVNADLRNANFTRANLSDAALQAANLDWADLTEVQAINTDFTCAQMSGVSLENWNIDSTTKLDNVESKFVYLLQKPKPGTDDRERRPSSGEFAEGEFTKLFVEVLDTVDLIFRNGIDWKAFMSSFKQVQVENEGVELNIQSIENKGDGVVVVKVNAPPEANKAKIHGDFLQIYEDTVKSLEEKHQAELAGKEGQLAIYRQQNEYIMSFLNNIVPRTDTAAKNPIKTEKLVVLNFNNGDLETGFSTVQAQIWSDGHSLPATFAGKLPAQTEIPQLYRRWQEKYKHLSSCYRSRGLMPRIKIKKDIVEQVSQDDIKQLKAEFNRLTEDWEKTLNDWLNSGSFIRIQKELRKQLDPAQRVRLIIQSEDIQMRKIPWHLWDFFHDYELAEVALSVREACRIERVTPRRKQIRILAILGNDAGIDVEKDRKFLEGLPNADTVFLVKPTRQELDKCLWDERGWDILCFSGHSESEADGKTGYFLLGGSGASPIKLTVEELGNALKAAIRQGLQLAIFNSCDSLGLARQLAGLHLPQIIVMREPVPDLVAQEFLKNFLGLFAGGRSLYISVRRGREMLQGMEDDFPCASWLPVICQNQAQIPLSWQDFLDTGNPGFEDLLIRLQEAIEAEVCLSAEDKTDALEQISLLAGLEMYPQVDFLRMGRSPLRMLQGIVAANPAATLMAEALENLLLSHLLLGENDG